MFRYILILFLVFASMQAKKTENTTAVIFASGNNKFVLPKVIKSFKKKYPKSNILVQYGATGDLANAILDGVNYDLFLSADMQTAQRVYLANKSATKPKQYAQGTLVLFVPADKSLKQKKLTILKDKKIKHITIANPKTAPYGQAAMEVLKNSNLFNQLSKKIRYSTDISTAITNVVWYDDAGFLSKSAMQNLPVGYRTQGVNWIEIDASLYEPIRQGLVISKEGVSNKCVMNLVDFILSKEGQEIYKENGYN
nr:molybdate ABC transporter substrate-binding protein [uncultured Sulfurimonas sp.]